MFDLAKLQSLANTLGSIAETTAEVFDPGLAPTITIANQVIEAATNLASTINNTGLDQTALQTGLQILVDRVEAHAKATEASLGPDEPTS